MWSRIFAWLIDRFGEAVLQWTVQQLYDRLHGEQLPAAAHGAGCECHQCGTVFDDDELGIDPEAEGWHHGE
jgi:hypothetical protein